jgi:Tfp pilus assembly protein PilF
MFTDRELRAFAGTAGDTNTDDNMMLEFEAGKRVIETTNVIHLSALGDALRARRFEHFDDETNRVVANRIAARKLTMRASIIDGTGRANEARDLIDRAYAAAPGDRYVVSKYAEMHLARGDVALMSGQSDTAIDEFQKALADPRLYDSWIAYHGMALAYLQQGLLAEAKINFKASLEKHPNHAYAYFNLADTEIALGDTTGAIRSYEMAWQLDPTDPDVANNLAWFYAERGENLPQALELATFATGEIGNPGYFDTLGWVYYKMGDLESAKASLGRALEIEPLWVEAMYHLALVHLGGGEKTRAVELLNNVTRIDQGEFAAQAGRVLYEIESD